MHVIRLYPNLAALATIGALSACAPAPATTLRPESADTRAQIAPEDLGVRVGLLADDSMAGRETGTAGAGAAARYLSAEVERLGFQPAGDNASFLYTVPLERRVTRATVSVTDQSGPRSLGASEILPVSNLGGLPRASRETGSGPLVFAGHMIDPDIGSEELALEQLRDAVVILRLGMPPGVDANGAVPRVPIATLFSPMSPAAAVLLIAEGTEAGFWDYAAEVERKGEIVLANGQADDPAAPPFFLVTEETAAQLIGTSLAEARQPRTDLGTLEFAIEGQIEPVEGWNVAAIFPGRDPARAGEYVALGAHYDHVGIGSPVAGDSIYNGADDNASGTSGLLEVAEALAHLPEAERPARSVLIVWNAAEESGLLGSEAFTDRPTVDRESIVAHVNLDMIGRNDPDSIFSVGSRRLSTELGDIVEAVNDRQSRPFVFDYSFDTPGHPEQIYCRSDHYNYARFGIPIVFLTTGLHDDYHAPSDESELIDYDKAARVSTLVFDLTMELANRPARLEVDQPVPPLGTPCT